MPTGNQYKLNSTDGWLFFSFVNNPVVEPMDGPLFVEHLMARFPEEVYSKSRDSHLYRFLTALVGDSGAGILKKESLLARLHLESALLSLRGLDNLYSPLVGINRAPNERYSIDPSGSTLTKEEWDAIAAADASYRRRAIGYLQAAHQGGTLQGIKEAASAAIGRDVSVVENYKYIFDKKSDNPINYQKFGDTDSVSEFIICPSVGKSSSDNFPYAILTIKNKDLDEYFQFNFDGELSTEIYIPNISAASMLAALRGLGGITQNNVTVEQSTSSSYIIRFFGLNLDVKRLGVVYTSTVSREDVEISQSADNDLFYTAVIGDPSSEYYNAFVRGRSTAGIERRSSNTSYLNPLVQKNLDYLVGKIKPETSIFSIKPGVDPYTNVLVNNIAASSERFTVNRFITGSQSINPSLENLITGEILAPGIENEERNVAFSNYDFPVVFLTIDSVISYTDNAKEDVDYETKDFYYGSSPAYLKYMSEHIGQFDSTETLIFPSIYADVSYNDRFTVKDILPTNSTGAVLKRGQYNGIYPRSAFSTTNSDYSNIEKRLWWASKSRTALELGEEDGPVQTSEFIEVDLGKRRIFNYLSVDVVQKPMDIEIQYDAIDLDDVDDYATPFDGRWKTVIRLGEENFDSSVTYQANKRNPWKHCEFYFTDVDGNPVISRRIRIKFSRRNDAWPTSASGPFSWSINAKNLRVGRFITNTKDICGPLLEITDQSTFKNLDLEVCQRFEIEEQNIIRARQTADLTNIDDFVPSDIYPKLMGFEVLVRPTGHNRQVGINWQLKDVTTRETVIASGSEFKMISSTALGNENGILPEWVRVYFETPIETQEGQKFEIAIRSADPDAMHEVYVLSPSPTNSFNDDNVYFVNSAGQKTPVENETLVYRVLADVGSSGKDLLGNEYREGVRYNSATNATDGKLYTNWSSYPNPSQDGVEALYFDVRNFNKGGGPIPSVIDAMEINALTPGVRVNVYFSNQEVTSGPPQTIEDWERIIWTPLRESFRVNQKEIIDFPYRITANWICLEFYNLQPVMLGLPNYPILPQVEFKEFPQWVYDDANVVRPTSDEPYLEPEVFVKQSIVDVFGSSEDGRGLRIYAETPDTLEDNFTNYGFGSAAPSLLSKVSFSQNPYASPTIQSMDVNGSLGAYVYDDFVNDPSKTYTSEAIVYSRIVNSRNVSNVNDRRQFTRTEEANLSFARRAAHLYALKKARYNKKAYIVSVSEVFFKTKDYTVGSDTKAINDVLVVNDTQVSQLIEPTANSWEPEQKISIPIGTALYVSYSVGGREYTDERVYFESPGSSQASFDSTLLAGSGEIATSVIAYSAQLEGGTVYYRDQDFVIVYDSLSKQNSIKRNNIPARLVVPTSADSADQGVVQSGAIITARDRYNAQLGVANNYVLISGQASVEASTIVNSLRTQSSGESTVTVEITTDFLG